MGLSVERSVQLEGGTVTVADAPAANAEVLTVEVD